MMSSCTTSWSLSAICHRLDPLILISSLGKHCPYTRANAFLLFSSNAVFFFLASLYSSFQMNVSKLLVPAFGGCGSAMDVALISCMSFACWRGASTLSPALSPVAIQSHLGTYLLLEDVSVEAENLQVKMQNSRSVGDYFENYDPF